MQPLRTSIHKPILCKHHLLDYLTKISPTIKSVSYYAIRNGLVCGIISAFSARIFQELLDQAFQKHFHSNKYAIETVRWIFPDVNAYRDFPLKIGVLMGAAACFRTIYLKLYPKYQIKLATEKLTYMHAMKEISPSKLEEVSTYLGIDLYHALSPKYALAEEQEIEPAALEELTEDQMRLLQALTKEIFGTYPKMDQIWWGYKDYMEKDLIENYLISIADQTNAGPLAQFALVNQFDALGETCDRFS